MHPLESKLIKALEKGEALSVVDIGDWEHLLAAAPQLGASPIADEFAKIVVSKLKVADKDTTGAALNVICTCFEHATSDLALPSLVDAIDVFDRLSEEVGPRLFRQALAVAGNTSLKPVARSAGIDGALRWALRIDSKPGWKHSLIAFLLGLDRSDDPLFLRRAAKIAGLCYSHWKTDDLKSLLRDLNEVDELKSDAGFELAMAELEDGICSTNTTLGRSHFECARFWFKSVTNLSEHQPQAAAYLLCLDAILAFEENQEEQNNVERLGAVKTHLMDLLAYHIDPDGPAWLGARNTQIFLWDDLAHRLHQCVLSLNDLGWLEPENVIRNHLVAILTASRSILRRNSNGLIEEIAKPHIAASLAVQSSETRILRKWVQQNQDSDDAEVIQALLAQIEQLETGSPQPDGQLSNEGYTRLMRVIDNYPFADSTRDQIVSAVCDSLAQHLTDMSGTAQGLFESCIEAVRPHPDFATNEKGRSLFRTVLLATINFLDSRNNMTKGHAPVDYLFEQAGSALPLEEDLQRDYSQMMGSIIGSGVKIEMSDVAGGRADVWFKFDSAQVVTEVKREMADASFDALAKAYSAQGAEYQNTNIRLGFVLVLDLTESRDHGSIHMSELVHPRQLIRKDESVPRWIIFVKVPGRRRPPNKLRA